MGFWDLLIFGTSLDASGGLVAQSLVAGPSIYAGNNPAGSATEVFPNEDGNITGFTGVSEDGAMTELRFHKATDINYIRSEHFHQGQAEYNAFETIFGRCMYPISKGDSITCDITNAAAKLDSILLFIGRGGCKPKLSSFPFGDIPDGAMMISGNTAHTATADTLTFGDVTLENYQLKRDKSYTIYGACGDGATLQAAIFAARTGPWAPYRPGIPCSDDAAAQAGNFIYFSDPWTFDGLTGFQMGLLCSAGDTSSNWTFLIKEN